MDFINMTLTPGKLYIVVNKQPFMSCCEGTYVDIIHNHINKPFLLLKDFNGPSKTWEQYAKFHSKYELKTTIFLINNIEIEVRTYMNDSNTIGLGETSSRKRFLDNLIQIS